jgi:hypothetical protein
MNQTTARTRKRLDVVGAALAAKKKAEEMRESAVKALLLERGKIDRDLKTLGYAAGNHVVPLNGQGAPHKRKRVARAATSARGHKRFKGLTLAQVGEILLTEHDTLHGNDIERFAKADGFTGGTNNFQNYLPVAFKRAGGFQNIGRNVWKLNRDIPAKR